MHEPALFYQSVGASPQHTDTDICCNFLRREHTTTVPFQPTVLYCLALARSKSFGVRLQVRRDFQEPSSGSRGGRSLIDVIRGLGRRSWLGKQLSEDRLEFDLCPSPCGGSSVILRCAVRRHHTVGKRVQPCRVAGVRFLVAGRWWWLPGPLSRGTPDGSPAPALMAVHCGTFSLRAQQNGTRCCLYKRLRRSKERKKDMADIIMRRSLSAFADRACVTLSSVN